MGVLVDFRSVSKAGSGMIGGVFSVGLLEAIIGAASGVGPRRLSIFGAGAGGPGSFFAGA